MTAVPTDNPPIAKESAAATTRAFALMCGALVLMPIVNTIAKLLFEELSPVQVTWGRFAFQALCIAPFLIAAEGWRGLLPNRLWGNVARGLLMGAGNACFYVALKYMAMADALAIYFVSPLILTMLSAILERERVSLRQWAAVAAGFIGALMIIRPSYEAFGLVALLPLCSAVSVAFYLHLNRSLRHYDSAMSMQFSASFFGTLAVSAVLGIGWLAQEPNLTPHLPDARAWLILAAIGAAATFGQLLVIHAFRLTSPARLAPLQYLEIVAASVLGYAIFGELPDLWNWVGIGIIVGSGFYVFMLQRGRP